MAIIKNSANKVYFIGTAELGPVNIPIRAESLFHVTSVFGYEGSLVDAYRASLDINNNSVIYLVKTTGTHSSAYLNVELSNGEILSDALYIQGKFANEDLDNIRLSISEESLFVIIESGIFGNKVLEYKYVDYPSLVDMVDKINEDTVAMDSLVFCQIQCDPDTLSATALINCNPLEIQLVGGNSGLAYNKNMMYNCLSETYSILESMEIDVIVPLDCNFDDTMTSNVEYFNDYYSPDKEYLTLKDSKGKYCSFYNQLMEFCIKQMRFGNVVQGILGFKLTDDPSIDIDYYRAFRNINNDYFKYNKYKHLITVCCGDLYHAHGTKRSNSSVPYSILLSSVNIAENTTNKPLVGNYVLYNRFNDDELQRLDIFGYTAFRYSEYKHSIVVSNGITMSDDKDLRYACNSRMIQLCMVNVKNALDKYIGTSLSYLINNNIIEKDIIALLEELVQEKLIIGYIISEMIIKKEGHFVLNLGLQTAYMTEYTNQFVGIGSTER